MITKLDLVNHICDQINITRSDRSSEKLSKRELLHLNAYIGMTKEKIAPEGTPVRYPSTKAMTRALTRKG